MPLPTDKRRTPRIQPFVAPCRVIDGEATIAGYVSDLSAAGARITADHGSPPSAGSRVNLEVRLPGNVHHTRLPAEVHWVAEGLAAPDSFEFGVSFEAVPDEEAQELEAALEEFRRRAGELGPGDNS